MFGNPSSLKSLKPASASTVSKRNEKPTSSATPPSAKKPKLDEQSSSSTISLFYQSLPDNAFHSEQFDNASNSNAQLANLSVEQQVVDPVVLLSGGKAIAELTGKTFPLENPPRKSEVDSDVDMDMVSAIQNTALTAQESKKSRPRRHPARMSRKERRKLVQIDYSKLKFSEMLELHQMWKEYVETTIWGAKLADLPKPKQVSHDFLCATLLRADLHGSYVSVIQSRTPEWVGISGVVFLETLNTLQIVTKEDRVMKIQKANCVFGFQIADYFVTLFGCQIRCRPAERSAKQFKTVPSVEM